MDAGRVSIQLEIFLLKRAVGKQPNFYKIYCGSLKIRQHMVYKFDFPAAPSRLLRNLLSF